MVIYIYDEELTLQGVIDEMTSFIWIRRYWKEGEFKLLVPFTSINAKLLVKNNLIMKKDDNEAAQIKYVTITKNALGLEEIEVQGKFITHWLDKRVVMNQVVASDTAQAIIERLVEQNALTGSRAIPLLEMITPKPDLQTELIQYASEPFLPTLLTVSSLAKSYKLGFKIETDTKTKKHVFKVTKGKDLTADQTENRPCIFSQEFDNIYEQEFVNSIENLKTVCYVGGEEKEGQERIVVEVGAATGNERDEFFLSASDITQTYMDGETEVTMPLETYVEMLRQRGVEELQSRVETLSFSSKVNVYSNLKYKTDFDIGDRVTCVDKRWGIRINVIITEITESYQKNRNDIDVTFGESLPTLFDKIKKK